MEAAAARDVQPLDRLDAAFNSAGVENEAAPVRQIDLAERDRGG